jgi:anti-anti-sigma regulatory factor
MSPQYIETFQTERFNYLKPRQDLSFEAITDFKNALIEMVEGSGRDIIFNFRHVNSLCSMSIAIIIRFFKQLRVENRRIAIVNISDELHNVFTSLHLTTFLTSYGASVDFLKWVAQTATYRGLIAKVKCSASLRNEATILTLSIDGPANNHTDIFPAPRGGPVIIDLSSIGPIDEIFLAALLDYTDAIQKSGGTLVLAGADDSLPSMLQHLDIQPGFDLIPTMAEALPLTV